MSYVVNCHIEKGGEKIEKITEETFIGAVVSATNHEKAKFFKIFSNEWTHHLEGEKQNNNHIDWIRVE